MASQVRAYPSHPPVSVGHHAACYGCWCVPTDYTTIRGDTFLCLPQDVFSTFKESATARTVNGLEILLVLAFFCRSPSLDASLAFAFRLFDTDHSDSIEVGCCRDHCAGRATSHAANELACACVCVLR